MGLVGIKKGQELAMRRRNSWLTATILAVLGSQATLASVPAATRAHDPYPRAAASYATVVDGQLLWGRNLDTSRPPASLTKLLTALVVLDSPGWSADAMLDVSRSAAHVHRTRVGLRSGDRVRAQDALTAMLVHSANDACMVLAERYGPGSEQFLARMNARAAALGMSSSHFSQPCGFDAPDQYSTARDLLKLAQAAYADPRIARIVAIERTTITTENQRELSFHSTNELLGRMDSVKGLKTGFTARAGRCVIVVAEQAGHKVWLVLLDSKRRWTTARRILTDAFARAEKTRAVAAASAPSGTAVFATAGAGFVDTDARQAR